ncbi:phage baseplate assembly protein V [Cronobacter dublinensis subsp. beijingensis]|uniref:phage baseplate assembly protein V n=1 Tax=Cronobacter dublinensis TaxID=413497 RepID=UPI0023DA53CB|nr:phage baseplate assembly protein V [Cronobacter dublinensis]WEP47837.1 phage baseplate assembly protein V [Cronobacter dublinensis]
MGIKQAISNLAARAVLAALDSSRKCQVAGLKLIAGDTKENVEYIEPYGFTSTAHAGAEAVVLFPSGDRSHGVVISVSDRRYRLKGLKSGEVAVYTDEGDSIVLKRGRVTEITTSELVVNAESKISLNAPQLVVNASSGVSFTTPIRRTLPERWTLFRMALAAPKGVHRNIALTPRMSATAGITEETVKPGRRGSMTLRARAASSTGS